LAEDPLPLRRAKITTEAAKKKADKAKEVAEAAEAAAEEKLREAEAYLEVILSLSLLSSLIQSDHEISTGSQEQGWKCTGSSLVDRSGIA